MLLGRPFTRLNRQVVGTQHNVLRRREDRLTGGWRKDIGGRHHEELTLHDRFQGQWHVDGHLITIEVGVISRADERVNPNSFTFDQYRLESLNGKAMQGRRTIQENRMTFSHLFEDVPDFRGLLLDHLAGTTNGVHEAEFLEAANDEWLE